MVGRLIRQKKKKEWTLEGEWVPEKAGLLSKKAWLQSQLENGRHLIPSTKLTSSSHKTFHFSYMKFLDEMFVKVKVSSIFKKKKI